MWIISQYKNKLINKKFNPSDNYLLIGIIDKEEDLWKLIYKNKKIWISRRVIKS